MTYTIRLCEASVKVLLVVLILPWLHVYMVHGEYMIQVSSSSKFEKETINHLMISKDELVVYCRLVDQSQSSPYSSVHLLRTFESLGIGPQMILHNSTWSNTFHFPVAPLVVDCYTHVWSLTVPRADITDISGENILTDEMYAEVSIGNNAFRVTASVIDLDRVPLLQWSLGKAVAHVKPDLHVTRMIISPSPCERDAAVVAPLSNTTGGIFIGVTHSFFGEDILVWYSLTEHKAFCDLFSQDCWSIELYDMKVTNHHVVLVTNYGILVSDDLSYPPDKEKPPLPYTLVEIKRAGQKLKEYKNAKLRYTPHCQARHYDSSRGDTLVLLFREQNEQPEVYTSREPFLVWKHAFLDVSVALPGYDYLLDVQYNHHTEALVTLFRSKQSLDTVVEVRELHPTGVVSTSLSFPSHHFSPADRITALFFHMWTNCLYALGTQVWVSHDGGNSFLLLHGFRDGDSCIDFCGINKDGAFLIKSHLGKVLYGKSGVFHVVPVYEHIRPSVFDAQLDSLGDVFILEDDKNRIKKTQLNISAVIEGYSHAFDHSLVPVYLSERTVVFFEYVVPGTSQTAQFKVHHESLLLTIIGGKGEALIEKVIRLQTTENFVTRVLTTLVSPFQSCIMTPCLDHKHGIRIYGWNEMTNEVHVQLTETSSPGGWSSEDVGKTAVVPGCGSVLLLMQAGGWTMLGKAPTRINGDSCQAAKGQWMLLDFGVRNGLPAWEMKEAECHHEMSLAAKHQGHTLFELDVGDQIDLCVTASVAGYGYKPQSERPVVHASLSKPWLFQVTSDWLEAPPGYHTLAVRLEQRRFLRGLTSVNFFVRGMSLKCSKTSQTIHVYTGCPQRKRLVFWYPHRLSQDQLLHGNPLDKSGTALLQNLEVNYRPPSHHGIDIPVSKFIYNADPSKPRPRNHFRISQESGELQQCQNKASRQECGCTDDMRLSAHPKFTDCRERVYRMIFRAQVSLNFSIVQQRADEIKHIEPFIIELTELNDRMLSEAQDSPPKSETLKLMKRQLRLNDSLIFHDPVSTSVTLWGSGLYHLKAEIIPGVTYCKLEEYILIFVDEAPMAYPMQLVINFTVSVIMGGVLFVVYLWYLSEHHTPRDRQTGPMCPTVLADMSVEGYRCEEQNLE